MYNRIIGLVMGFILITVTGACSSDTVTGSGGDDEGSGGTDPMTTGHYRVTVAQALEGKSETHEEDDDYTWDSNDAIKIQLADDRSTITGEGAVADGNVISIVSAGTYVVSGTLSNGKIIVQTEDEQRVRLVLNGVDISNATSAPIDIENAEKVVVILADNTTNRLTDAATYVFPSADIDEPNAALYSVADLSITGGGSLEVKGNYNDGIASKDGLIISGGSITVTAVDDGIRGKDYLVVKGGSLNITSSGDGLKSDNDEDTTRGYVLLSGGNVQVVSALDAVSAETDILISSGTLNLVSGGGSTRTVSSSISAKGLKGVSRLIIDDGSVTVSSADDGLHTNGALAINGGTLSISSADDGIHADSVLGINGGIVDITKSYEGIESNVGIAINDGQIHVTSSDDGINAASGNGETWTPGGAGMSASGYYLYISGGFIVVNATGDGLDINGSITMTGGNVLVHGPISNANGALDYDQSFVMNGGFLVAAGSAGMAMAPGTNSSQYSVLLNFSTSIKAGTLIHIQSSDGEDVLSFAPNMKCQSIAFSSSKLKKGQSYDVYTGGTYTGTVTDGLYSEGNYSPGSQLGSFSVSSISARMTM